MLQRYAERRGFQHRDALDERERRRRLQGSHLRGQGRRRLLGVQVGGRDAPRPARARDGVAGTHPHVDSHGRRHARGGGGRGRRSTRTTSRSTSTARPGPAGRASTRRTLQYASRISQPGSSSRCRTRARSSRTGEKAMRVLRARLYEPEREKQRAELAAAAQVADRHRRARREDPHLQLSREPGHRPPDQADGAPARPDPRRASSTSSPRRCGAEERRRALEAATAAAESACGESAQR